MSKESQAITDLFKVLVKYLSQPNTDVGLYRLLLEEFQSLTPEPTDVLYEEVQCPGTVRPAIWCKPLKASSKHVILYFHGGAFTGGSPSSHRKMVAHLAKTVGCYALIPDYRRAPDHQFPSQIEDGVATFRWLRDSQKFPSKNIVTAGDSAGGNLSITTALKLKASGEETQAAIAGLSPWLDMKMTGESYQTNRDNDVLVDYNAISTTSSGWVGDASLDDPLIDLLNTDLRGLPPLHLATGGAEMIASDAITLGERAKAAGVEATVEVSKSMQHLYFLMVGRAPEANKTIEETGKFLREKLGIH